MEFHPHLDMTINGHTFSYKFFETLKCVSKTYSQREAARKLRISHAVLNRRIRDAERKLGIRLVETTAAGSGLSPQGQVILAKYDKYLHRLESSDKIIIGGGFIAASLIDNLIKEYDFDARVYSSSNENMLYLADREILDLLILDDPLWAFIRNLDFIPLAYDHLVLIPESSDTLQRIEDLSGKEFVEIAGSVQRLAWNTLDEKGVDYKIVKVVQSPLQALKAVRSNPNLYTFLNGSYCKGSDVLKKETKHLISLVVYNKDNEYLSDFISFLLGRGQSIIRKNGFEPVKD